MNYRRKKQMQNFYLLSLSSLSMAIPRPRRSDGADRRRMICLCISSGLMSPNTRFVLTKAFYNLHMYEYYMANNETFNDRISDFLELRRS